jgi:hypothetical protein
MTKILQRPTDTGIAPGWVVLGHPSQQPSDLLQYPNTPGPALHERPLARNQLPVPPVSGVTIVAISLRS